MWRKSLGHSPLAEFQLLLRCDRNPGLGHLGDATQRGTALDIGIEHVILSLPGGYISTPSLRCNGELASHCDVKKMGALLKGAHQTH